MTVIPTKTALGQAEVKYAAVIRKLDAIAEELVKAELWDEQRIQTVAGLRYIYKDFVGTDKKAVELYIKTCSGNLDHYLQHQPIDTLNNAKIWKAIEDDLGDDAWHFYQGMLEEYDQFTHYLPEGWSPIRFRDFDWEVKPLAGEQLLDTIDFYTSANDAEELVELDVLGDDRELCGEALVMTGYLSNQENLTGDDLKVLQAYKAFSQALAQVLVDEEEG